MCYTKIKLFIVQQVECIEDFLFFCHSKFHRLNHFKTHIHKWVCSTETYSLSPIPDFILLCYITECVSRGSNGQAHNLNIWSPWTPSRVRLPNTLWTALFAFRKMAHGKKLGESSLKSYSSCCRLANENWKSLNSITNHLHVPVQTCTASKSKFRKPLERSRGCPKWPLTLPFPAWHCWVCLLASSS